MTARYNHNTSTIASREGRGEENLCRPNEFRCVGASIGHKSSPTLHSLLKNNLSDMFTDEEDGLVGMFHAIHPQLPSTLDENVYVPFRQALERLWQAWLSLQSAGYETSQALTDSDVGMSAMFRELFVNATQSSSFTASYNKDNREESFSQSFDDASAEKDLPSSSSSATASLDAMLAKLLHSYYKVQKTARQTTTETAEVIVPTPTAPMNDVDVSLGTMFREASQHFPSTSRLRSADDVERHLLGRLQ